MRLLLFYLKTCVWIWLSGTSFPSFGQMRIQKTIPALQTILDDARVEGFVLIFDPQSDTYYSNDFEKSSMGYLPASTFKIPHSVIALETGVVAHDSTLIRWNGEKRFLAQWERDMTFQEAFQLSCVPCYQEIAQKIGYERMKHYLSVLDYGLMVLNEEQLQHFWLRGESRIHAFDQIDFLERLHDNSLPVSGRTMASMKKIMLTGDYGSFQLYGKTGLSIQHGKENAWFVGYIENDGKLFYFASQVSPLEDFPLASVTSVRREIIFRAFAKLNIH